MKKYGIYLAFHPEVELQNQGLGRHLIAFLKATQNKNDLHFVIACPSWSRKSLHMLFEENNILKTSYTFLGPKNLPLILASYIFLKKILQKNRKKKKNFLGFCKNILNKITNKIEQLFAKTRNPFAFVLVLIPTLLSVILITIINHFKYIFNRILNKIKRKLKFIKKIEQKKIIKKNYFILRLFQYMQHSEMLLINKYIKNYKGIKSWYCPTAFWPLVNEINEPLLLCVPDVVLTEFPVGFACLMSEHSSQTLRNIEKSIKGAKHFVTYSEHIKWKTLVHEFHQDPDSITVIHHGTNTLSHLINLNGFGEQSNFAKHSMCKSFVNSALSRMAIIKNDSNVKFIFYSSQFRPNKNIINLLKAYQFLLKRKYIGIKLVLTGNIDNLADIGQFISDNNLNDDIICLYGLSEIELSSFYYLSELAVNPSLSEGGFPFTFSEALSVDTPVVMSRIPVSEEIITCPHLRQEMFFDPYDWKDMAERILWALNNKETLLGMQKTLYQKLSERTWEDCANEYIELLDKISDVNLKEIP